jgi:hypothetical protein
LKPSTSNRRTNRCCCRSSGLFLQSRLVTVSDEKLPMRAAFTNPDPARAGRSPVDRRPSQPQRTLRRPVCTENSIRLDARQRRDNLAACDRAVPTDSRRPGITLQVESEAGSGKSDPTPTGQRAAPADTEATAAQQYRSLSVGLALSLVPFPPRRDCNRQAGDDHPLASRGVPGVLALALTQSGWQTEGLGRAAQAHWRDEPGEPPLGCATHSGTKSP